MKRSAAKGGRPSARKAPRVARTKPGTSQSAPPFAANALDKPFIAVIEELTLERDKLRSAVRDVLAFYDRVPTWSPDNAPEDRSADFKRLAEIRALVPKT